MGSYLSVVSERKKLDTRRKIKLAQEKYIKKILEDTCHMDEQENMNNDKQKMPDFQEKIRTINPTDYIYPFENLVFEGGGNKGLAYCGAIKVLEDIGLYSQIKRFAGTSAGAMTAALLAVGYNSKEIEEALSQDLSRIFLDASFGYLSFLPNLLTRYGWNPGNRIYKWFGEALAKKCGGNADITFLELYKSKEKTELCIVVTNLSRMVEEYCHVKTTPNMPIRLAVRMSMSVPGMFQAMNYTDNGETNTYVDGGVLCNYPIHCYDGWWLSMKPGDSFIQRLQPLDEIPELLAKQNRFIYQKEENKTLGFLLYADSECDLFRYILEKRIDHVDEFPETKLARSRPEKKQKIEKNIKPALEKVTEAVHIFFKVLKKNDLDKDGEIDKTELKNVFKDAEFTHEHINLLFGENCTPEAAFAALVNDREVDKIHYYELIHFIQSIGICLQQLFLGYQRQDITGLYSFCDRLQNTLLLNLKRVFVEPCDLDRTVGINTGHVGTSDFRLEPEDRKYVIEQGRKSMESFLKYYATENKLKKIGMGVQKMKRKSHQKWKKRHPMMTRHRERSKMVRKKKMKH